MATTDRPGAINESCDHAQAVHRHGTVACYNADSCRCSPCSLARKHYDLDRNGRAPQIVDKRVLPRDEWLDVMRKGLREAVSASIQKHGRIA